MSASCSKLRPFEVVGKEVGGIVWKYLVVSVAAKMSLKLKGSTRKIPKIGQNLRKISFFSFSGSQSIYASTHFRLLRRI